MEILLERYDGPTGGSRDRAEKDRDAYQVGRKVSYIGEGEPQNFASEYLSDNGVSGSNSLLRLFYLQQQTLLDYWLKIVFTVF